MRTAPPTANRQLQHPSRHDPTEYERFINRRRSVSAIRRFVGFGVVR